jgi:nitrogen fixation/metabolism regulation signal transduction histidine kinase
MSWRSLLRIGAGGAVCALLVLAAGGLIQRFVLGVDDAGMRVKVETEVRSAFDRMARRLREMALEAGEPATIHSAIDGDTGAIRRLLTSTAAVVSEDDPYDSALTIYSNDGEPVAWSGRPTELLADRLQGEEAWFGALGASGLRLMYVRPVMENGTRIGTIAVERPVTVSVDATGRRVSGLQGQDTDAFRFRTWIAEVSLQLRYEGEPTSDGATTFAIDDPSGSRLLTATIDPDDLAATRSRWQAATRSIALIVIAVTILLFTGPLVDWRNRARSVRPYVTALVTICAGIIVARIILRAASPADWSDAAMFSGVAYASSLFPPFLTSAFDFLLTSGAAFAIVTLLLFAIESLRLHGRQNRQAVSDAPLAFVITQVVGGFLVAALLLGHVALLQDTIAHTNLDLLHFSLHPWEASRLTMQVALLMAHAAAIGLTVVILRAALHRWRIPRTDWRMWSVTLLAWTLPAFAWQLIAGQSGTRTLPLLAAILVAIGLTVAAGRLAARYRHGSQAFRLTLLTLPMIAPAFAFYPTVVQLARDAKEDFVEARYAPQVRNLRQNVQMQVQQSLSQIDAMPELVDLITTKVTDSETLTDRAFQVWQSTALATYPITSSIELYGPDGKLVSRFAFNLPEDLTAPPTSEERSCDWDLYEEVAPFFAEERRVLHAGRAFCSNGPNARPLGSIVVHALPDDYGNLPFISSRNPYVELLLPPDRLQREGLTGRDVEFAVYGWSRSTLYSDGSIAWPLPDEVFARVEDSRTEVWAQLARGQQRYDVYLLNDRGGIYALGFPVIAPLDHLVNLAEVTVLALFVYVLLLLVNAVFKVVSRRELGGSALLRELRASFYRKLFLAFVAAVFVPVVALVLVTRNYVAAQMEASIEQEAIRTASAAGRVVEDLAAPRAEQLGLGVDDNLMVWVSRLIDQDVNMFVGARLLATSERNLFASGLLPTRVDAAVYHALALRNEAASVTRERIGEFEYLVAATPLPVRQLGILTVPLTSRQRDIDEQLDTLDRRALLAALLFILAGAGLGYSMAERISDPVNRLTRATRRIARGDLDARIAATSSDELRRLVEAFNNMAADLQRQRGELERTHRLEAWAEMARQVAHEIKNPLTPIQLNAEHLRRVHADRGEPLGPVLQECVATILAQVKLLRQIASEFSSFASSPTARPAEVDVSVLLHEIVDPYRIGLDGRIQLDVTIPPALPPVFVDRNLISRSLTNIVENALHAMPGSGILRVAANAQDGDVRICVSDTGVGMDEEALARAFEPYFSTKASGTGLGLPIAKRNVELSGGTIAVQSARDQGTTVEISLPALRQ